jgi:hypothetical protein
MSADGSVPDWKRELARRFGALPVYGDIGGALLVATDGRVWSCGWDAEKAEPADEQSRLLALIVCVESLPELGRLLPARPKAAPDCPLCRGAGVIDLAGIHLRCGHCAGLGWVPVGLTEQLSSAAHR